MSSGFTARSHRVRWLRESVIEDEARHLLAEWRAKGHVVEIPVPLDDLVEIHLGLAYEVGDLQSELGVSGVLGAIWFGDRRIVIDSSLDPNLVPTLKGRFNFTLAHEIGHWQLHREQLRQGEETAPLFEKGSEPAFVCRDGSTEPEEWQANRFAGALLMPREELLAAWREHRGSDEQLGYSELGLPKTTAERIANVAIERYAHPIAVRFAVSAEAMRIRLQTLELVVPEVERKLY